MTGKKLFVAMAAGADAFLVTATGGLALVERGAPGVDLLLTQTQDGGNFGTLTLDNAPAEVFPGDAADALETAALATSAYLLGLHGPGVRGHARVFENPGTVRPQDRVVSGVAAPFS